MTDFLERWANASDANARLVAQEMLIAETTEALWEALERAKLSKTELADRMGCTKGHVSQVLSGARNMTLRTLSDICFATGVQPKIVIESRDREEWRGFEGVGETRS